MAPKKTNSAKRVLLKVLLWLPICFLVWYLSSPILLWPIVQMVELVLSGFFPQVVEQVVRDDYQLNIVTRVDSSWLTGKANQTNVFQEVLLIINALKYGYGIPLYVAMTMAVPQSMKTKLRPLIIGVVVLLIVQVWGVCFDSLRGMVFEIGMSLHQQVQQSPSALANFQAYCQNLHGFGCTDFTRTIIALGYQLGYLIFPGIVPVVLWAGFQANFLSKISKYNFGSSNK